MPHAKFVIADKFAGPIEQSEADFQKFFDIESRSEITLNVKHACKLERKRRADFVRKKLAGKVKNDAWIDLFEQLVEMVYQKDEEQDNSKYYVYVLSHKQNWVLNIKNLALIELQSNF